MDSYQIQNPCPIPHDRVEAPSRIHAQRLRPVVRRDRFTQATNAHSAATARVTFEIVWDTRGPPSPVPSQSASTAVTAATPLHQTRYARLGAAARIRRSASAGNVAAAVFAPLIAIGS